MFWNFTCVGITPNFADPCSNALHLYERNTLIQNSEYVGDPPVYTFSICFMYAVLCNTSFECRNINSLLVTANTKRQNFMCRHVDYCVIHSSPNYIIKRLMQCLCPVSIVIQCYCVITRAWGLSKMHSIAKCSRAVSSCTQLRPFVSSAKICSAKAIFWWMG